MATMPQLASRAALAGPQLAARKRAVSGRAASAAVVRASQQSSEDAQMSQVDTRRGFLAAAAVMAAGELNCFVIQLNGHLIRPLHSLPICAVFDILSGTAGGS